MKTFISLHARLIKIPQVALDEIAHEMKPLMSFLIYTSFLTFNSTFWLTPPDMLASIIQNPAQALFGSIVLVFAVALSMVLPWMVHWLAVPYLLPNTERFPLAQEKRTFYRNVIGASVLPHVIYAYLVLMPLKLIIMTTMLVPPIGFLYPYLLWANRLLNFWTIITIAGVYIIRWAGLRRNMGFSPWVTIAFEFLIPIGLAVALRILGLPLGTIY